MSLFPQFIRSIFLQADSRSRNAFTLVELLVVMAIIAILLGTTAALVPSLLHGNQMNEDVTTLAGILENARSTAISGNTYVYVGFTAPPASPADGISVIVFESQDGTDAVNGFGNVTFPMNNLQLVGRIQRLTGVQLADTSTKDPKVAFATLPSPSSPPVSLVGWSAPNLQWQFTTSQTLNFIYGFEFAPNGEARVTATSNTTWYDLIEFGLKPAIAGQNPKDVAVIRLSRLTGKATFYRP